MSKYLLACKEINGLMYVTRLDATQGNPPIPGLPQPWEYIGPGSRPSIHEYTGNQFILVFDYLSHMTARVFDITTWPPTQVDPIQTTPIILIGGGTPPQGPDDSILAELNCSTQGGYASDFIPTPVIQASNVIIDSVAQTATVTITTVGGWQSYLPGTNYFRVYRQPISGGPWTMVQDWVAAPLNFSDQVSTVHSQLQYHYYATVGAGFNTRFPNFGGPGYPAQYDESFPSNILTVDSTIHPLAFIASGTDSLSLSSNGLQSLANANFGSRQLDIVEAITDSLGGESVDAPSSGTAYWSTRQTWVALYSPSEFTDSLDFNPTGQQGQATMATGPRQDQ